MKTFVENWNLISGSVVFIKSPISPTRKHGVYANQGSHKN